MKYFVFIPLFFDRFLELGREILELGLLLSSLESGIINLHDVLLKLVTPV